MKEVNSMAELTQEEALGKYARLVELLETEDYERLDPLGEYPGEEEEVEDELHTLRSWARKHELVFVWTDETWTLEKADEDTKATWKREHWLHRHAGFIGSFMLQDKHYEDSEDAASVDSTSILGVLPHKEDEPRTWLVRVDARADSGFGYSYPTKLYLTIRENPEDAEDKPMIGEATDAQVKQVIEEESEDNA
jgi:hypothetical protein